MLDLINKDIPAVISKSYGNIRIYTQAETAADVVGPPLSVLTSPFSYTDIFLLSICGAHDNPAPAC